ncbi:pyrimidine reductase family protein [Skermania sp. ID1734]|uniref:pyrimidine reductase family protein n=1 Tax=Skermania sp. ID1734 TaxID=2597516 RepID=UPI00163D7194|nr:pyrimidine reductase family protein [Skermania sp. ID1734]
MQRLESATYLTPSGSDLSDEQLRDLYAYPGELTDVWLRVNFISSIDGAADIDGFSGGLGTDSDRQVFGVLRELADVILVGAGTARIENYGGARTNEQRRERRLQAGLAAVPPIAVVTASASIEPTARLLTDTTVPPIILTTKSAPPDRKEQLRDAGAKVLEIAPHHIDSAALLDSLRDLGLLRVLCEGGPGLFGQLAADDRVDDLCLTFAPVLTAGTSRRIAVSTNSVRQPMTRAHVLSADDGTLLTRWVRNDSR